MTKSLQIHFDNEFEGSDPSILISIFKRWNIGFSFTYLNLVSKKNKKSVL